ncbi:MAG TPA: 4-alpha-glucanotransferase [Thermoanaerobaculia bacterium]|nr:4-alpha-glucanotransferase [Thermoanaerobaculia bacterium]
MANEREDLATLAHLHGVQTSYNDAMGNYVEAGPDSLLAVLRALQAPVEGMADVPEALRERREELDRRAVEPVTVAWDGHAPSIELYPANGGGSLAYHLDLESGERRAQMVDLQSLPEVAPREGSSRPGRRLTLAEPLPPGYHRLTVEIGGRASESLILSAPTRCHGGPPGGETRPLWGAFLPLYALRTSRSWGAGDFSDLETLAEWTSGLGGGVVATLPLLATFLDEPFEPSPYAPASRLFWNELYVDPRRLPEMEDCLPARRLIESPDFLREVEALRAMPRVDYARLMALKRRVLEELAQRFFSHPGDRQGEFERFVAAKPGLNDYAAFRAVGDRRGESWQSWPERLREGTLAPADYDDEDRRYYLWTQWAADQQLRSMAGEARKRGPGLYLDLPVGVHGSAYDVWRHRDLFAEGVSAGAPPDSFFTKGQEWGFPPLQPERLRERGYDYLIDCLRHHLEHAGILRLDHVMQLHRLFWVPRGMGAAAGVYVRYPAEELYAVLSVESHRYRAIVVGENLGTVPPEVYEAMDRHEVLGMYVVQYELQPGSQGLRPPPAQCVASLNTHDMPTFEGFLQSKDVDDLQGLGFFTPEQARQEKERRGSIRHGMEEELPPEERGRGAATDAALLRRRLEHLATSPARMVLVSLEDLWQETEPQNVPGTHDERPNWRRKARFSFEEFSTRADVVEPLRRVDELRKRKG